MTDLVTIVKEPKSKTYLALLHFALRHKSLFSLVWRDQLDFDMSAITIAERLLPDFVSEKRIDEWPGTRLFGHFATVRLYRMSAGAVATLAKAGSLYAWTAPVWPEDLAFYVSEDRPWLGSIAHERDAFIYQHAVDPQVLSADVPGLRLSKI